MPAGPSIGKQNRVIVWDGKTHFRIYEMYWFDAVMLYARLWRVT